MVTAESASLFILLALSALLMLGEGSWLALALETITQAVRHTRIGERAAFLCAGEDLL
jgi:hypothetical protein